MGKGIVGIIQPPTPPTPWDAYIDAPVYGTCTHICVILEKYGPAVFVSLMCYFYLSICQYLLSLVQDEHSSENTPYPLPHPIYIYPPFTRICILSSNLHPPHFFWGKIDKPAKVRSIHLLERLVKTLKLTPSPLPPSSFQKHAQIETLPSFVYKSRLNKYASETI